MRYHSNFKIVKILYRKLECKCQCRGILLAFRFMASLVLIAITAIAFYPSLSNQFIHYDDQFFITDNAMVKSGLTIESFKYAFTSVVVSNWHPVTMLSHMLNCQLFGLDPTGQHLTNVIIHIIVRPQIRKIF